MGISESHIKYYNISPYMSMELVILLQTSIE